MQTYTLDRTGKAPLRFDGERLAVVSTRPDDPGRFARWYEIGIYRTRAGKYVLSVAYRNNRGEPEVTSALACGSPGAMVDALAAYDPLEHVAGFPPGAAYVEKQRHLERSLTLRWKNAVRDVLAGLAGEFAEELA